MKRVIVLFLIILGVTSIIETVDIFGFTNYNQGLHWRVSAQGLSSVLFQPTHPG